MKKSTDLDFSGSIHQIDLDSLQSFFHHGGGGHHPSPAPGGVNFRSIDGSSNNLADPTMNQTGTDFARVGPANFSDGIRPMTPGPNAHQQHSVAQADTGEDGPHLMDDNGVALSGMMYAWGQFVDHDLDLESRAQPRISRSPSRTMTSFCLSRSAISSSARSIDCQALKAVWHHAHQPRFKILASML